MCFYVRVLYIYCRCQSSAHFCFYTTAQNPMQWLQLSLTLTMFFIQLLFQSLQHSLGPKKLYKHHEKVRDTFSSFRCQGNRKEVKKKATKLFHSFWKHMWIVILKISFGQRNEHIFFFFFALDEKRGRNIMKQRQGREADGKKKRGAGKGR